MDPKAFNKYLDHAAQRLAHYDQTASVFAKSMVTAATKELFELKYRVPRWSRGDFLTLNREYPEGAHFIEIMQAGETGRADIIAPNGVLPRSDVEGRLLNQRVVQVGTEIEYTTKDIRSAALQGVFKIANLKGRAARKALDFRLDELIRNGDSASGLPGITNLSGINNVAADTGNWNAPATTDENIAADLQKVWQAVFDACDGVIEPDTCVLPSAVQGRVSQGSNYSAGGALTLLANLKARFENINLWAFDPALNTAGPSGGPAVMMYSRDRDNVHVAMPMDLRPSRLVEDGLCFKQCFEVEYAGVVALQPQSVGKLYGV